MHSKAIASAAKRFGVSEEWARDLERRAALVKGRQFVPTPDPNMNKSIADDQDETVLV